MGRQRDTEQEMRTTLTVCGGGGGGVGESRGLRSRVGKMKRLLWLKPSRRVEVHMDTEPGIWLTSFQLLDTAGQCEVSDRKTQNHDLITAVRFVNKALLNC